MQKGRLAMLVGGAAVVAAGVVGVTLFTQGDNNAETGANVRSHSAQLATPPEMEDSWQPRPLITGVADPEEALTPGRVAELWAPFAQISKENEWTPWGYVVDADTGEILLNESGTAAHVPASTMKVLTGLAAMETLEPGATLETGASIEGSDLYLWGEGDLLLSAGESTGAVNGQASLKELAASTAAQLDLRANTEISLTYQDRLFDGPKRLPAWAEQEVEEFAGDVGPYAIDTGRTAPNVWEFVDDSAKEVADVFAAALKAEGVTVKSITPGDPGEDAEKIAVIESAPLYEQIQYMLVMSDNTLAEQYCHLAASVAGEESSFSGSTEYLRAQLGASGVEIGELVADDCSGLSERNRVEPRLLVEVIAASSHSKNAGAELIRLLPRGGVNGTMTDRFEGAPAHQNVQAKTGSLGAVSSLAGIVTTASGQNLIFAVGVDDAPDWTAYYAREPIDDFVSSLLN